MSIITNYLLFNHTYLRQLQADSSVDDEASIAAQGVREWYGFQDRTSTGTLVQSWVAPMLQILELELQPYPQQVGDSDAATYLLYTAWDHEKEAPVGLCYVTPPGANLDTTTKGRHWMAQAILAARHSQSAIRNSQSAIRWIILTNGDQWRLLDAQALRRYEAYLQVDLGELARHPSDLSALRLFYRCFHRSAFAPLPRAGGGGGGLDRLLAESDHATEQAEDHLKARVSHNEGIMARLCLGFVQTTGKTSFTEAERDGIYRDATYLLYRILFILYAEARELLPTDNPAYRAVSLTELIKTAYDYKLRGMPDGQATTLWERLKRLCTAIYESDAALNIPAYNGGLFDDADKPHLREGSIADAYLTEALFDLAYMPVASAPATRNSPFAIRHSPIDYRDLSVRHLGSIYEGMIEYRLQIAEETLWARRDGKGNVRFLRTGQDGAPRRTDVEIKQGDVYFSQSPGERRATGTYYTPEHIVDYIVRQTVWRGLEERRASLEEKLSDWLEEIAAAITPDERARMQRTADEELLRFVKEQVLTFRVCDIGMGSGHFLVNAAHQITNFIVETLHLTPWKNELIDANPAAWRRRVVERCVYGVDLSLMAVELAKLSLWLASVAEGKPLSFLDHHLRQGNSLIGARLEDLAEVLAGVVSTKPSRKERKSREAGQLSMLDDPAFSQHVTAATGLLAQISARVVERAEDVKAQAADYEQVRAELEPYRRLADIWTARHFGVDVDRRQMQAIGRYLVSGTVAPVPGYEQLLSRAESVASEMLFFHWDLEMPNVFLTGESRGFTATVGNPPYGGILNTFTRQFILAWVSRSGTLDLFVAFLERALDILTRRGILGFIIPSSWQTGISFVNLRKLILSSCQLLQAIELPYDVFPDAYIDTGIYVIQKERDIGYYDEFVAKQVRFKRFGKREPACKELRGKIDLGTVDASSWYRDEQCRIVLDRGAVTLMESLARMPWVRMDEMTISARGVLPNDEDLSQTARGDNCRRYFDGDVYRYVIRWSPQTWIKYGPNLREQPGSTVYFEGPRVLVRRLISRQSRLMAAYIDEPFVNKKDLYNIKLVEPGYSPLYLTALLNSSLFSFAYITRSTIATRDDFPQVTLANLRALPVRRIEFSSSTGERKRLADGAVSYYGIGLVQNDFTELMRVVDERLELEPEQSDIVHDLLAYLAQQMIDFHKGRQRLERKTDLFRFVERDMPCLRLDKALGGPLAAGEMASDLSTVRHDIEGLRLSQKVGAHPGGRPGRWLLEVRAKLRDPDNGWRKHQRDRDGNFVRQWLPAYRLPLDEAAGRFYHYAFAHLRGFDGAGKFPGGYTRTTLDKLHATKVPQFVPVNLAPLEKMETELAEVRRKIQLTDDLIDQIVYKLYGLTEEEIAIVEGR